MLWGEVRGAVPGLCWGTVGRARFCGPRRTPPLPSVLCPWTFLPLMWVQSGHRWSQARTFQGWRPQVARSRGSREMGPSRDWIGEGTGREVGHSHGCREVAGRAR